MGTTKEVLQVYIKLIKQYRLLFIALFVSSAVATTIGVITPLFYKRLFDVLAASPSAREAVPGLVHILWIILGMNALGWLFWRTGSFLATALHTRLFAATKQEAFKYMIHHSHSFFTNNFGGALVQKVNRLARSFERIVDRVMWDLTPMGIRIIGVTIALWYINKVIAMTLLIWTVVFMVIHYLVSDKRKAYK